MSQRLQEKKDKSSNNVTYQNYDVTQPRVVLYKPKLMIYQNAVYWVNLPEVQKGRLTFYQTRSNAITFQNFVSADRIEKVLNTRTKEILYEKVYFSPRSPPKFFFQMNKTLTLVKFISKHM